MSDAQTGYFEPDTANKYLDAETTARTVDGAPVYRQRVTDPATQDKLDLLTAAVEAVQAAVQGTLNVSGTINATVDESTLSKDATLTSGDQKTQVTNFPATQPVSGPLTNTELRATSVPVSGPLTDTQLRATALPVTSDTELPAAVALTDADPNPTAPTVGAANMGWSGASWRRLIANNATDGSGATSGLWTNSIGLLYNGTTFDRLRSAESAQGTTGTGLLGAGGLVFNGTNWVRTKSLDAFAADAFAGSGGIMVGSAVYNGTNWDRVRSAASDSQAATGIPAAGNMLYATGSVWNRAFAQSGVTDASTGSTFPPAGGMVYNGTTWDRVRSVQAGDGAATGLPGVGDYVYNGTSWDRVRSAQAYGSDGHSNGGLPIVSPRLFNGTTYDRLRDASAAVGTTGTGLPGAGLMVFDGTNWQRVNSQQANGDASGGANTPQVGPRLFNGTNYDRLRDANGAQGTAGTGLPGAAILAWDTSSSTYRRVVNATSDSQGTNDVLSAAPRLWNGSSMDRERGNTEGTLLASAARTATTQSPNQTNYNARGVIVWLNVTAIGTGNLVLRARGVDPVSGNGRTLVGPTVALTATGLYAVICYPGQSGSYLDGSAPSPLPRTWFADVTHSDGSSWTYSLGYSLVV